MLERRRRSQLRLEPLVSVPARTTMTRRTRRVTFNIEANGSVSPRGPRRRRRRELLNPYLMPMPMMYNPAQPVNPWGFNWNPNNLFNGDNFMDRLTGGDLEERYPFGGVDDFEMDSGASYDPAPQPPMRSLKKSDGQQAIDDLKDILFGLETHLAAEKLKCSEDSQTTNKESETEAPENPNPPEISEISVLTDFMSETVEKLNNYLAHHSQEQNIHDNHMDSTVTPPVVSPTTSPVQVLLLPVQPLIVQNVDRSNPNSFDSEAESRPPKRQYINTLPWLKKPKKRPPKSSEYVRVQNRGSSTEDLDTLPKILEASKSAKMCNTSGTACQTVRDEGTTMWCPMECCRQCCGVVRSLDTVPRVQKMLPPSDNTKSNMFNPPQVAAPPPSQLSSEEEAEIEYPRKPIKHMLYRKSSGPSIYLADTPRGSNVVTSPDFQSGGGHLTYSYVEEEEEEREEAHPPEAFVDEDDWSDTDRKVLSEWEKEQQYQMQIEMSRRSLTMKNKQVQTDAYTSSESSSLEIIATTDKAISTTDISIGRPKKPVQIFSICKRSSFRRPYRMKSGSQSEANKVQFEKTLQTEGVQVGPEMRSVGTNPLRLRRKESHSREKSKSRRLQNRSTSCDYSP
ncbi:hypothetical protein KR067_004347, partial [Drosophila pandora]